MKNNTRSKLIQKRKILKENNTIRNIQRNIQLQLFKYNYYISFTIRTNQFKI